MWTAYVVALFFATGETQSFHSPRAFATEDLCKNSLQSVEVRVAHTLRDLTITPDQIWVVGTCTLQKPNDTIDH